MIVVSHAGRNASLRRQMGLLWKLTDQAVVVAGPKPGKCREAVNRRKRIPARRMGEQEAGPSCWWCPARKVPGASARGASDARGTAGSAPPSRRSAAVLQLLVWRVEPHPAAGKPSEATDRAARFRRRVSASILAGHSVVRGHQRTP